MLPVLTHIQLFGVSMPIYGYGAMMALGLLVGGGSLLWTAKRMDLDVELVLATSAVAVFCGYCGAHGLFLLIAALDGQPVGPLIGRGGLVFYGAAIGGGLGAVAAARAFGLPVSSLLDASAVPLALGHALGRVGCLLGGCCFGRPFSGAWAVTYVHPLAPHADGIPRHPVQAYEALALVVLALALLGVPLRKDCAGLRFSIYVATYAVLRMVLETLRADDVRGVYLDARMSTSQLLSAMLLAGALAWLYRHRTRLTTS